MKIFAVGDLHGDLKKVKLIPLKEADLILATGDLGKADLARKKAFENIEREKKGLPEIQYSPKEEKRIYIEIYNSTIKLLKYLSKFAHIYMIYGNVELKNSEVRKKSKEIGLELPLLIDNIKKIKNLKIINNKLIARPLRIGGLEYFLDVSWVEEFKPEDFKEQLKQARKETAKAKKTLNKFRYLDILLCHQPPYGILDKVKAKFAPKHWRGKHAGSKIVLDYIKKYHPKYVFCGHIHEGKGMKKIGKTEVYNLGVGNYKLIEI